MKILVQTIFIITFICTISNIMTMEGVKKNQKADKEIIEIPRRKFYERQNVLLEKRFERISKEIIQETLEKQQKEKKKVLKIQKNKNVLKVKEQLGGKRNKDLLKIQLRNDLLTLKQDIKQQNVLKPSMEFLHKEREIKVAAKYLFNIKNNNCLQDNNHELAQKRINKFEDKLEKKISQDNHSSQQINQSHQQEQFYKSEIKDNSKKRQVQFSALPSAIKYYPREETMEEIEDPNTSQDNQKQNHMLLSNPSFPITMSPHNSYSFVNKKNNFESIDSQAKNQENITGEFMINTCDTLKADFKYELINYLKNGDSKIEALPTSNNLPNNKRIEFIQLMIKNKLKIMDSILRIVAKDEKYFRNTTSLNNVLNIVKLNFFIGCKYKNQEGSIEKNHHEIITITVPKFCSISEDEKYFIISGKSEKTGNFINPFSTSNLQEQYDMINKSTLQIIEKEDTIKVVYQLPEIFLLTEKLTDSCVLPFNLE